VHAYDRTQPGVEVKLATTVDQLLVREIGKASRIPSIEMSVDFPTQGSCDSGDCFYVNTVSWRNETTPNNTESHPRILFERLFGDGGSAEARQARTKSEGSILDSVRDEANRVANSLGRGDKAKLHEYLDSVREIEQRIQNAESQPVDIELPERPTDIPSTFDAHTKLMFDLQALAFASDTTRVFAFKLGRDASNRVYPESGYKAAFHSASHHQDRDDRITEFAKINKYHVSMIPYFLNKLKNTADGESNLLENTLVLYGSPMGNSNVHNHKRCPLFLAGHAGGRLKGGVHLKAADGTPMANVMLTVAHMLGMDEMKTFGDSTAAHDLNTAPSTTVAAD
jgi:hypothetical protein